jgi:hypothetical protein
LHIVTQSIVLKTKNVMGRKSYNDEPVYYCRRCLSLKIRQMPMVTDMNYCEDCGNVDIVKGSIKEWDELYVEKYGHHYLEKEDKKEERRWPY